MSHNLEIVMLCFHHLDLSSSEKEKSSCSRFPLNFHGQGIYLTGEANMHQLGNQEPLFLPDNLSRNFCRNFEITQGISD